MFKKIKKWNWTLYFVFLFTALAGAMGNENCKSIKEALILGFIGGNILGLPFAIITKEN